jgi:hypothetical protein
MLECKQPGPQILYQIIHAPFLMVGVGSSTGYDRCTAHHLKMVKTLELAESCLFSVETRVLYFLSFSLCEEIT